MKTVDVYWSFRSPYSYLATPDMLSIQEEYEVSVNLRVVMPIAIRDPNILFTEAGILRVKYIQLDWARRAEFQFLLFSITIHGVIASHRTRCGSGCCVVSIAWTFRRVSDEYISVFREQSIVQYFGK